jgi:ankyrin repeat protein
MLMYASRCNDAELVKILLEHGADIYVRNHFGNSAYTLARHVGAEESENILARHKMGPLPRRYIEEEELEPRKVEYLNEEIRQERLERLNEERLQRSQREYLERLNRAYRGEEEKEEEKLRRSEREYLKRSKQQQSRQRRRR